MSKRCADCQYPLGKFYDGLCADCKILSLTVERDNLHELYEAAMRSRADHIQALQDSQAQVVELTQKLAGLVAGQTKIEDIGLGEGALRLSVRPPLEIVSVIASALVGCLQEAGAPNYVEIEAQHERYGPLVLTVQRRHGKTPHQLRKEAEAEIEKFREIARDEDAKRLNAEHEVVLLREENDKLKENIRYAADYLEDMGHALTAAGLRGRCGVE